MNKQELLTLVNDGAMSIAGDIFRAHITRYKRPDVEVYVNVEKKSLTIDASQGDHLIAKIRCTNGHNSWLWNGYAHTQECEDTGEDVLVLSYVDSNPVISEDDLIEDCIVNGDWDWQYLHFVDEIESQVSFAHFDWLED